MHIVIYEYLRKRLRNMTSTINTARPTIIPITSRLSLFILVLIIDKSPESPPSLSVPGSTQGFVGSVCVMDMRSITSPAAESTHRQER